VALLQHLSVNVDYVYTRLTVSASFARVVKDTQCDVPRPTRDIDAADVSLSARTQKRDKGVLPEAVHAEGHGIVHDVIA